MRRSSTARPSQQRRSPRERLLSAATELFARRGYAATPVREIVERAGVTKPVLYYHFGSKEGIYRALVAQVVREFDDGIARASAAEGDARERIIALCVEVERLVRRHLDAVRVFYNVFYAPPEGSPPFDAEVFARPFRDFLADALRESVASGAVSPERAPEVALAIEAVVSFIVDAAVSEPQRTLSEDVLARMINLFYRGAAPAAAESPMRAPRKRSLEEISR